MKRLIIAALATACSLAAAPASAALMLGKTVQLSYIFPSSTSTYEGPYNNVVGTTGTQTFFGIVGATPGDASLALSFNYNGISFTPAAFNGVRLFDAAGTVAAFQTVTINAATNLAGFDASRVTFDTDNVYLNIQGLNVNSDSVVKVDISGAVPEPAAWTLMIAGFGLVGGALRRRATTVAA